jgi:protein CpxP
MKRYMTLAGIMVAILATAAYAAGPGGGPATSWGGPDHPLKRVISGCIGRMMALRADLNVTEEQRSQIREVIKSHRAEIATTLKSVQDARTSLRDLVLSDSASESEIRSAANNLGQAIADAAVKGAELRKELAPILTAEQRELISEALAKNDASIDTFLTNAAAGP